PGQWPPMTQAIEGYKHKDGVRNVLRLTQFEVDNAPAGAASTAYVLDMVVVSEVSRCRNTRKSACSSRRSISGSVACTVTLQQSAGANAAHLTASFSVISTGESSPKSMSARAKAWWSGYACSITSRPCARRLSKKRCGWP